MRHRRHDGQHPMVESHDLVGSLECDGSVRDGQDRHPRSGQIGPQCQFRFDVEGARQVVENDQLRLMHERPCRCQPLSLASRQSKASRPDQGVEAIGQRLEVGPDRGMGQGALDGFAIDQPQRDVLRHRIRDELRDLREKCGIRRNEEGCGVFDDLAVPTNLTLDIGLPSETILQSPFLRHPEVITAANTFYMWVHFPGTAAFLFWAWFRHQRHFGIIRASLITLTTAGLLLHLVFPLAPPRMMKSAGYIDTGAIFGPSPYDLAAASAANQIAAMPSLHVGWALLIAISVIALSRSRFRYLILLHPILTTMVVVVTANHYWTDAIIAALLVMSSWLFMTRLRHLSVLDFDHRNDPPPPPPPPEHHGLELDLRSLEQSTQVRIEDFAELACTASVSMDR